MKRGRGAAIVLLALRGGGVQGVQQCYSSLCYAVLRGEVLQHAAASRDGNELRLLADLCSRREMLWLCSFELLLCLCRLKPRAAQRLAGVSYASERRLLELLCLF